MGTFQSHIWGIEIFDTEFTITYVNIVEMVRTARCGLWYLPAVLRSINDSTVGIRARNHKISNDKLKFNTIITSATISKTYPVCVRVTVEW